MSTTHSIDLKSKSSKSGSKLSSGKVVAATAATVAAAGAGTAAWSMTENDEELMDSFVEEIETPQEENVQETPSTASASNTTASTTSSSNTTGSTTSSTNSSSNTGTTSSTQPSQTATQPQAEQVETPSVEINEPIDPQPVTPESNNVDVNEIEIEIPTEEIDPVNPDEIAEAIIAEEQVDPTDIDLEEIINFDEIGVIETIEGENLAAAAFHDAAGNNLIMVDLDGDEVFDIITDMDLNPICAAPDGFTVDDAELDIYGDDTYLAHNDGEMTDEFGADTIEQDLIS